MTVDSLCTKGIQVCGDRNRRTPRLPKQESLCMEFGSDTDRRYRNSGYRFIYREFFISNLYSTSNCVGSSRSRELQGLPVAVERDARGAPTRVTLPQSTAQSQRRHAWPLTAGPHEPGAWAMTNSVCNYGQDSTRPPGPATTVRGCSHESFRQAPRRTRDAHLNRRARAGRAERSSRRRRSERRRVLPLAASNGGARPREPVAVRRRGRSVCCGGPGRPVGCGVRGRPDAIASPGSLQRQPPAGTGMKRRRGWEAPRKDGRAPQQRG